MMPGTSAVWFVLAVGIAGMSLLQAGAAPESPPGAQNLLPSLINTVRDAINLDDARSSRRMQVLETAQRRYKRGADEADKVDLEQYCFNPGLAIKGITRCMDNAEEITINNPDDIFMQCLAIRVMMQCLIQATEMCPNFYRQLYDSFLPQASLMALYCGDVGMKTPEQVLEESTWDPVGMIENLSLNPQVGYHPTEPMTTVNPVGVGEDPTTTRTLPTADTRHQESTSDREDPTTTGTLPTADTRHQESTSDREDPTTTADTEVIFTQEITESTDTFVPEGTASTDADNFSVSVEESSSDSPYDRYTTPMDIVNKTEGTCPQPERPHHGWVRVPQGITPGAMVIYGCQKNFGMEGYPVQTCLPTGVWDGAQPTCHENSCPNPKNPKYGWVRIPGRIMAGSSIQYICRQGFTLEGNAFQTCLETGMWNDTQPTCNKTNCSEPEIPDNGWVNTPEGTELGSLLQYGCQEGFTLEGNPTQICLDTGVWNGTLPSCSLSSTPVEPQLP